MSIFSKLFGKKQTEGEETSRIGGMEDFMTLIRVYYQSVMLPSDDVGSNQNLVQNEGY